MTEEIDKEYKKIGFILNKAGPFPVSDPIVKILKISIAEEDLDFLLAFKRNISQTMEQLKESITKYCKNSYSEEEILTKIDRLAKRGVMFDQPNRKGIVIFRLAPIYRQFEYTFMKKLEKTEENMAMARLFDENERDMGEKTQKDYDKVISIVKTMAPMDRTVPIRKNKETGEEINIIIDKEVEVPEEKIINAQNMIDIIKKYDDIAVGRCYCRQKEEFLGRECKQHSPVESCFTLGKSARHTAKHGFSRLISQEEALKILEDIEDAGLAHKVYHLNGDISKEEVAICNCCYCCCPTSRNYAHFPVVNVSNFIADIDQDSCSGCGTCVENCFNQVLQLNDDDKAELIDEACVGCGVCAYLCPENAISLIEGPQRRIPILPPRKS